MSRVDRLMMRQSSWARNGLCNRHKVLLGSLASASECRQTVCLAKVNRLPTDGRSQAVSGGLEAVGGRGAAGAAGRWRAVRAGRPAAQRLRIHHLR